jgi:hypothetical protein
MAGWLGGWLGGWQFSVFVFSFFSLGVKVPLLGCGAALRQRCGRLLEGGLVNI